MNCCKNDNDEKNKLINETNTQLSKPKHKGHLMHMALCCGVPLLLLLLLPLFGYKGILQSIIPFICPIMMIVMIPMMMRGHGDNCSKDSVQAETKSIDEK